MGCYLEYVPFNAKITKSRGTSNYASDLINSSHFESYDSKIHQIVRNYQVSKSGMPGMYSQISQLEKRLWRLP